MKNMLMSAATAVVFAGSLCAQSKEVRSVGDFNGIRTNGAVVVIIKQSADSNSVVVEAATAKAAQLVTANVENGILVINTDKAERADGNQITVRVAARKLSSIEASGSSAIKCKDTLQTDSMRIQFSGASEGKILVKASKVDAQTSGASELKLYGETETFKGVASGASELKAFQLRAQTADVVTSGASTLHTSVYKSISGNASGASTIRYYGPVSESLYKSGGAEIEHREGEAARPGSSSNDTLHIPIGNGRTISIAGSDFVDDERSEREKDADDDDFKFWRGLDFGVNGYLSADNQIQLPNGFEPFELNYAKSYVFGWNMFQKNLHIYRNNLNLGTGLGLTWYHYNFKGNYTLASNVPFQTSAFDSTRNFSRNRLNMCYVNVPLFLEYNSNNNDADHSFHVAAGMQFGYNIFRNKVKQRFEMDGQTQKRTFKDSYNVNPFRFDAIARIGYGEFTLFGSYSLTTLFEREKGPVFYPWSAGLSLNF
ncbi:MAG: DUF2807 domain-containing protein [Bacteroidetes bacterium]|nr:DUF2807 domain-containing protein [Bacteroidota bacterium]